MHKPLKQLNKPSSSWNNRFSLSRGNQSVSKKRRRTDEVKDEKEPATIGELSTMEESRSFVGSFGSLPSFQKELSLKKSSSTSPPKQPTSLYSTLKKQRSSFIIPQDHMEMCASRDSMRWGQDLSQIRTVEQSLENTDLATEVVKELNKEVSTSQDEYPSPVPLSRYVSVQLADTPTTAKDMFEAFLKWLVQPPAEVSLLSKKNYILYPEVPIKNSWDMWIGVLIVIIVVLLPFQICFLDTQGKDIPSWWENLEHAMTASFIFDVVLTFFCAYEDEEKRIIDDLKKIALNYAKGYLFLDFIAAFPFEYVSPSESTSRNYTGVAKVSRFSRFTKFFRLLRLLRLLKIYHVGKMVRDLELKFRIHQGLSRLNRIIMSIVLVNHVAACVWFYMGRMETYCGVDNPEIIELDRCSWLTADGYAYDGVVTWGSIERQYMASFYFSLTTLTTVGYGDISGGTEAEQIFCMLLIIFGVGWYSYIISSTSTIISSFTTTGSIINQKKKEINRFIRDTGVNRKTGFNIKRHFDNLARKKTWLMNCEQYDANEIINRLSPELRSEVITFLERRMINQIPFLQSKAKKFQADLVRILQPKMLTQNDTLFSEHQISDGIYFITDGRCSATIEDNQFGSYNQGERLGESGLLFNGIQLMTAKAVTQTCHLETLPFQVFYQLQDMYEEEMNEIWKSAEAEVELIATFKQLTPGSKKRFRRRKTKISVNFQDDNQQNPYNSSVMLGTMRGNQVPTTSRGKPSLLNINSINNSRVPAVPSSLPSSLTQGKRTGIFTFPEESVDSVMARARSNSQTFVTGSRLQGKFSLDKPNSNRLLSNTASWSTQGMPSNRHIIENSVDDNLITEHEAQHARAVFNTRVRSWQSFHLAKTGSSVSSSDMDDAENLSTSKQLTRYSGNPQLSLQDGRKNTERLDLNVEGKIDKLLEERTDTILGAIEKKIKIFGNKNIKSKPKAQGIWKSNKKRNDDG